MMGRHRYTLLVTMVVWAGLLAGVAGQDPAVEAAQLGGMKLSELSSWLSARSEVAEADISNCLDADNPKQAALVLARSTLLVAAAGPGDGGRVKEDRVTDELPCTIERRIACKKKKKKNKNKTEQGENMEGKCLGPREFERRFHQKAPVIISGLPRQARVANTQTTRPSPLNLEPWSLSNGIFMWGDGRMAVKT